MGQFHPPEACPEMALVIKRFYLRANDRSAAAIGGPHAIRDAQSLQLRRNEGFKLALPHHSFWNLEAVWPTHARFTPKTGYLKRGSHLKNEAVCSPSL